MKSMEINIFVQHHYRNYATIAANATAGVTPEQAAVWSYPMRQDIKYAVPYWPLDIADNEDMWVCGGLQLENKAYLAVWKRQMEGKNNDRYMKAGINCTDDSLSIPLDSIPFVRDGMHVSCIYPKKEPTDFEFTGNALMVHFKKPVMARIFELRID